MTVSAHVRPVTGSQLKSWLSNAVEDFHVLLLDCRSFLSYNNRHIIGAHNVHCPHLLRRRSTRYKTKGKAEGQAGVSGLLPLDYLVPCSEARAKLLAGFFKVVVVYDDESFVVNLGENQQQQQHQTCNITWVIETLHQEPLLLQRPMEKCFLIGGFNQFSVDCPSLCTAATHDMPSPPLAAAAPVNRTPTQPTHHSVDHRACKTPTTSSSTPCSPRLPLLRRNRVGRPALSLPNLNLKCMNSTNTTNSISPATEDYKATMKSSSGSKTPSHSLHPVGRSSNSHQHAQHQRSSSTPTGGLAQDSNGPVRLLPHLYIGSNYHASRQSVLEDHGITAVLNVSRLPNYFPTSFRYMQIPVDDNTDADLLPWFEESTDFIESVEHSNGRVLVHCHAGISRSATICLAYLMKVRGIRLEEAFEIVRSKRTIISPNLSFMIQLLRFQDDLASSRKENVSANSPCNHNHSGVSSFFNSSTNQSSSRASKYHHLSPSFAESKSTTMSSLSSPGLLSENSTTRQLCIGSSALLMKRMARSVSLPLPLQLPISHSKSQCSSPASRKTSLTFDFNLSVLPKSCSMECPDLSPTPSPIFSPM